MNFSVKVFEVMLIKGLSFMFLFLFFHHAVNEEELRFIFGGFK